MSARAVHIVDYGVGNIHSVVRAFEKAGGEAVLTHDPEAILRADRLVLPGVGAFGACVEMLNASQLVEPVKAFARSGRPFFGICVGMQLLFDFSEEFGRHPGLGLIPGHVAPIPTSDASGARKVPHIGWSPLLVAGGRSDWSNTILEGQVAGESSAYFVHSFACEPDDDAHRLADVDYLGFPICAAVQSENVIGAQFHPEKSGIVGLSIIQTFLAI